MFGAIDVRRLFSLLLFSPLIDVYFELLDLLIWIIQLIHLIQLAYSFQ